MTDAKAFEAFVRTHQDMVFGTAVRLLGDASEAEDVSQTVFLRAFERFDSLATSPTAGGWLRTVTTNACLNHLSRVRARWWPIGQRGRQDEAQASQLVDDRLAVAGTQSAELERAEQQVQLEAAIRRLPSHQRVPLVLFHFQERSYREIAALLGISLAKVKTDIHRGREALKHLLVTDDDAR